MLSSEPKIAPGCEYFIYTCSQTAKRLFFYPVCVGLFRYEPGYSLTRSAYDSFLVMAVTKGSCRVWTQWEEFTANSGDVVLLDCYAPHAYSSQEGWEASWLHFDGPQSRAYYEYLTAPGGCLLHPESLENVLRPIGRLCRRFQGKSALSEPSMSLDITELLTGLALTGREKLGAAAPSLGKAVAYIQEHFAEPVSLERLASLSSLSPYYFTRLFTKETGQTPHQYLLSVRIDSARFLLRSTAMSVKEIGFACGFSSESSFNSTFRKRTGVTPGRYREEGRLQP